MTDEKASIFNPSDDKTVENKIADSSPEVKIEENKTKVDSTKESDVLEKVIKRLNDSQDFIKKLELENSELRKQMEKAKSIEDVLQKIDNNDLSDNKSLDTKTIDKLIESRINQHIAIKEQQTKFRDNGNKVANVLKSQYGADAESVFNSKAKELGKSPEELHKLAFAEPNLVLNLFKKENSVSQPSSYTGGINTEALLNKNSANSDAMTKMTQLMSGSQWNMTTESFKDLEEKLMKEVTVNITDVLASNK